MKVTYLGTTVLLFDDGEDQLLFDAHFTRPSLLRMGFGSIKTNKRLVDCVIDDYKLDRLRGIFISHTHTDHVMDAPYLAKKCNADIYGSASAMNVARGGKISEKKLHCYDDSFQYKIGKFEIKIIPSIHSKAHWYNDDLGQTIDKPLKQPARKSAYKEGGSYDFLVKHMEKIYLIRPSYNYIEGQLDGIQADILFLGITGIAKESEDRRDVFYKETIEKVHPQMVIPLHWDNFLAPLYKPSYNLPSLMENTQANLFELAKYCSEHDISCAVQLPLTYMML